MNEVEYIQSIDACFPYEDEEAWKAVIDRGVRISDNAAYMALYEICCGSGEVPQADLQRMLEYWSSSFDHPTKPTVLKAARSLMNDSYLSEERALKYLDEIAAYPGLYNAVGIVWQAAPRDRHWFARATKTVEEGCETVYKRWEGIGGPSPAD